MKEKLENLVVLANEGDKNALESIILRIKDMVYNISLKMLLYPTEAEDATQEILVKVITHLSTFNHQSKFTTWVYRVARNYLHTYQGKKMQSFSMSFQDYAELIDSGQSNHTHYARNEGELSLLEEEVKISCTQGLLLCLSPNARMVYIVGEILEIDSKEGSIICNVSPENFRKILSRSRSKLRNFLNKKCGLANPNNPCRCKKKIDFLTDQNIINPHHLRFAQHSNRSIDLVNKINTIETTVAIYRSTPEFKAPDLLTKKITDIIHSTL